MNTDEMRIACTCGMHTTIRDGDAYENSDWEFFGERDVLAGEDHYGYCPGCNTVRRASFDHDEAEDVLNVTLETPVIPPEFTADGDVDVIGDTLATVTQDGTPVLGLCPECETPLCAENRRKGPEEPELGWEYYCCSDCQAAVAVSQVQEVG